MQPMLACQQLLIVLDVMQPLLEPSITCLNDTFDSSSEPQLDMKPCSIGVNLSFGNIVTSVCNGCPKEICLYSEVPMQSECNDHYQLHRPYIEDVSISSVFTC